MQALLEAYGVSLWDILNIAPWISVCISTIAFVVGVILSRSEEISKDPYEPMPGRKWILQTDPKHRSREEPPLSDEMKEEIRLCHVGEGQWPSWYIDWDFNIGAWDWAKGWRRDGLPPMSKRGPGEGQRWYWQENVANRGAFEPAPNEQMVAEEALHNSIQGPWPPWYLTSQRQEIVRGSAAPAELAWVWRREWKRDGDPNLLVPNPKRPDWAKVTDAFTARKIVSSFLMVYFLIMMADWIQGPYAYAVYKELGIPENQITMLFGVDSIATILTGRFTGLFTDRLGRKRACMMFCVAYTLNCCSMVIARCWVPKISILVAGRLFRGIATNLLYSAFESWFIATYDSLKLRKLGYNMGRVFGYMTVIKGGSAFLAGILSEEIVHFTGSKLYTMIASCILFVITWLIIAFSWEENYGMPTSSTTISAAFRSLGLFSLNIVSAVFNLSLDMFTLFWARSVEDAAPKMTRLPYPLIYNTFLGCTIFGALMANILVSTKKFLSHENALTIAILISAASLTVPFFAGSNFVLSFAALCLFRMCTGTISPAISQLKYNIVPNSSRAEIYTLFHLPFFQWAHWMDYALIYIFGSHPDDIAEKIFLYLSMVMAISGVMWYIVNNDYQMFATKLNLLLIDSKDLPEDGAYISIKEKLYRILRALKFVYYTTKSFLSITWSKVTGWPVKVGDYLIFCIAAVISDIFIAVKWTIERIRDFGRWMFLGGQFPQFRMSPPPVPPVRSPIRPIFPPGKEEGGDGSQDDNFKRFWNSSGILSHAILRWGTALILTGFLFYPLLWVLVLTFGIDLTSGMHGVLGIAWRWTADSLEYLMHLVDYLLAGIFSETSQLSSYLYASSLDNFTTCSRAFFVSLDWGIRSFFELWSKVYTACLAVVGSLPVVFNITTEPVKRSMGFFIIESAFVAEISDTLTNAFLSIETTISGAVNDSKDCITDVYKSTLACLLFFAKYLIPDGSQNSTLVTGSQRVTEIYEAGSRILLKEKGWFETINNNFLVVTIAFVSLAVIGYIMPWSHLGKAIRALVGLIFREVYKLLQFARIWATRVVSWVFGQLGRLFNAINVTITGPFTWTWNIAGRIYESLPSPIRIVFDPSKFLLSFLLSHLIRLTGSIFYFFGCLMERIGHLVGYLVSEIWGLLQRIGLTIEYFTKEAFKELGNFGWEVWRAWMWTANWLKDTGDKIYSLSRRQTSPGSSPKDVPLLVSPPKP